MSYTVADALSTFHSLIENGVVTIEKWRNLYAIQWDESNSRIYLAKSASSVNEEYENADEAFIEWFTAKRMNPITITRHLPEKLQEAIAEWKEGGRKI